MIALFIYALVDPLGNEERYVGKSKDPNYRMQDHLKDNSKTYKVHWLKKMQSEGRFPILKILETVSAQDKWQDREKFWIKKLKSQGCRLTNSTPGGEGGGADGRIWSLESRQKLRSKHIGMKNSPETRKKLSAWHKTPEAKLAHEKMRKTVSGRPWTPLRRSAFEKSQASGAYEIVRATLRSSHLGKTLTPEQKASRRIKLDATWALKRLHGTAGGYSFSDEQCRKMSESGKKRIQNLRSKGLPVHSEKARQAMSLNSKRWWAERRLTFLSWGVVAMSLGCLL